MAGEDQTTDGRLIRAYRPASAIIGAAVGLAQAGSAAPLAVRLLCALGAWVLVEMVWDGAVRLLQRRGRRSMEAPDA